MKICLQRDYRINISAGRAYRLMKSMNLPKMSTVKPFKHKAKSDSDEDITKLMDYDSNTFCPQPISIHKIIKECSAFSSEEIKSALCLLDQSDIIKINTNYNGKLDKVVITKNGYFEILKRFL